MIQENLSSNQKIQEEQYQYPYHYIPQWQKNTYDFFQSFSWGYEYLTYLHFIIELLHKQNPSSIVDIGCGDGRFLHEVKKKKLNADLFGLDYSSSAIALAIAMNRGITFEAADIFTYEPSKKFSCITLIETLEHIPPELSNEFIKNILKFCEKDSQLIISVPHKNLPLTKKHYQHFDASLLENTLHPYFHVKETHYLNKKEDWLWRLLRRTMINPLFISNCKPWNSFLFRYYQKNYTKTDENKASRILVLCQPKI